MSALEAAHERTKRTMKQKLRISAALGALCLPVISGGIVGQYSAAKDERAKKVSKLTVAAGYEGCAQFVDSFNRSGKVVVPLSVFNEREKADCGIEGLVDTNTKEKHPFVAGGQITSNIHIDHKVTLPKAAQLRSEAAHITDANRDTSSGIEAGAILYGGWMGFVAELGIGTVAMMVHNKRTTGDYLGSF